MKHVYFLYRKTEATRIDWKVLHQEARKHYVYTFLIYDTLNPACDTVSPLHRLLVDSSFCYKMLTALIPRDSREYFIHMHIYGQLSWDELETFNLNSLTSNWYPTFFFFFLVRRAVYECRCSVCVCVYAILVKPNRVNDIRFGDFLFWIKIDELYFSSDLTLG